jgi:hypothetical protein
VCAVCGRRSRASDEQKNEGQWCTSDCCSAWRRRCGPLTTPALSRRRSPGEELRNFGGDVEPSVLDSTNLEARWKRTTRYPRSAKEAAAEGGSRRIGTYRDGAAASNFQDDNASKVHAARAPFVYWARGELVIWRIMTGVTGGRRWQRRSGPRARGRARHARPLRGSRRRKGPRRATSRPPGPLVPRR